MNKEQKEKRIQACIKEYFLQDEEILLDASILELESLRNLLGNNTFFGNKVYIFSESLKNVEEKHPSERITIVKENVAYLRKSLNKHSQYFKEIFDEQDSEKDIIHFLQRHKEMVLYTKIEGRKEKLLKMGLRVRSYRGACSFDWKFVYKAGFADLSEIHEKDKRLYLEKSDRIEVYRSLKEKLCGERIYLKKGYYLLYKERMENGKMKVRLFQVVNYHSRKNLMERCWSIFTPEDKTDCIRHVSINLRELVSQELF